MTDTLPPGATIGILGGGQLGRMLSVAASRLGFKTHVFEPAANPPARLWFPRPNHGCPRQPEVRAATTF